MVVVVKSWSRCGAPESARIVMTCDVHSLSLSLSWQTRAPGSNRLACAGRTDIARASHCWRAHNLAQLPGDGGGVFCVSLLFVSLVVRPFYQENLYASSSNVSIGINNEISSIVRPAIQNEDFRNVCVHATSAFGCGGLTDPQNHILTSDDCDTIARLSHKGP